MPGSPLSIPCVVSRGWAPEARAEKGVLEELGARGARLRLGGAVADGAELSLSFTAGGAHFEGARALARSPERAGEAWRCAVEFAGDWAARVQEALLRPRSESILLLEDDAQLRRSLESALGSAGYRVRAADGVARAVAEFAEGGCDLAVIDLNLPDGSGLELLRRIRSDAKRFATPALILTADGRLESKLAGLAFGADQYLVKPVDPVELLFWAAALLRRTRYREEGKGLIVFAGGEIDPNAHRVVLDGRESANLSRKEFDLLYRLIAASPRVLSKRYILSALWHTVVTDNTVEVHVKRLRQKLGPGGARRIVTVPGKGYKFR